jgi:hypothetical protein
MRTEPRGFACRAETGANLADAKYLGRCKLRLLELLLAQGLDAVFVDPGVLVLSPLYLERLVRMGRDLAVGSAWPSVREVATALSPPACPAPPPRPAPWCLRPARSHAPRPTSQARQSGYGDNNLGSCLRIPPAYKLWVNDWVSTGQFYLRSSPGALWFVQEVRARTHAARAVRVGLLRMRGGQCVVRVRLRARLRLRVCERASERDRDHTSR